MLNRVVIVPGAPFGPRPILVGAYPIRTLVSPHGSTPRQGSGVQSGALPGLFACVSGWHVTILLGVLSLKQGFTQLNR